MSITNHETYNLGLNNKTKGARYWLETYRHLDPANESDGYFSIVQEQHLMLSIADAKQAIDMIVANPTIDDSRREELEEIIAQGKSARQALFEVNIPFAEYFARESVGIIHPSSSQKLAQQGFKQVNGNAAGTFKPLSSMKSPYASLEDRLQVAREALWDATAKAKSGINARFVTYASWWVQAELQRYADNCEHNGIRLTSNKLSEIQAYFRSHPAGDSHPIPTEVRREILMSEYMPMPDTLFNRVEGSVTEMNDPWTEDDVADRLYEVVSYDGLSGYELVSKDLMREAIHNALESLSPDEAAILRMRFGIGCSPLSLDEIGEILKKSKQRILKMESEAMAKLRQPSQSEHLRDYVDSEPDIFISNGVERGDDICLPTEAASHYSLRVVSAYPPVLRQETPISSRAQLESWQYYPDEQWGDAVRFDPEEVRKLSLENLKKVTYSLDTAQSWHFDTRVAKQSNKPYSLSLMKRIEAQLGAKKLSYRQFEQMWDVFMSSGMKRLEKELGPNLSLERVGRMFSKMIESYTEHPTDPLDRIMLYLNSDSKPIPYLASELTKGNVCIVGDVGSYVGAYNTGLSSVDVIGNAGSFAGEGMTGFARLAVKGSVYAEVGNRRGPNTSLSYYRLSKDGRR